MSQVVESLVLDLLEWLGQAPRPYIEVMDAWRTSCPRLSVWEEANELGFVERRRVRGRGELIFASRAGMEFLDSQRPLARP
jgi:hypothetical protein